MPSYVKTTGSSGLHILLPLGGQCTFEQSRMLGQLIAHHVESEHPEIATTRRTIRAREGKVYIDFLQNRHGQLLVAPYSVRPIPGAPVSAPLTWREVNGKLTPRKWTIANLPARLRRRKADPVRAVLDDAPDLLRCLERLATIVDR
jgi:bifunctional non-homologous end joining protein LigD